MYLPRVVLELCEQFEYIRMLSFYFLSLGRFVVSGSLSHSLNCGYAFLMLWSGLPLIPWA